MSKISPILPFRADVSGNGKAELVTVDDQFAPDSMKAEKALVLGCLSDADARAVRAALAAKSVKLGKPKPVES